MIRYAENRDLERIKKMWKTCFPSDSESVDKFYFKNIYRPQSDIVYAENETNIPLASLQIIPYTMKLSDKTCIAGYIYGAMTHPDSRNRGYMRDLIAFAEGEMVKRGMSYAILIPGEKCLFHFYEKLGYQKAFPLSYHSVEAADIPKNDYGIRLFTRFESIDVEKAFKIYRTFLLQKENVVFKNSDQFELLLKEVIEWKGLVFLSDSCFAFAFEDEEEGPLIVDMICERKEERDYIYSSVAKKYRSVFVKVADYDGKTNNYIYHGMIKALNKDKGPLTQIYMSMMHE